MLGDPGGGVAGRSSVCGVPGGTVTPEVDEEAATAAEEEAGGARDLSWFLRCLLHCSSCFALKCLVMQVVLRLRTFMPRFRL